MDLKFPQIFFSASSLLFIFFQQVFEAVLAARPEPSSLPRGTELRPGAAEMESLQKGSCSLLRETWTHRRVFSRQAKNLSEFPGEFFQEGFHHRDFYTRMALGSLNFWKWRLLSDGKIFASGSTEHRDHIKENYSHHTWGFLKFKDFPECCLIDWCCSSAKETTATP